MRPLTALVVAAAILADRGTATAAELIDPAALGFGAPGFTLDTTLQDRLGYGDASGGFDALEVRTLAPLGKLERGSWLFGASLNYCWTHADFGALRGLGTKELQTIEVQLFAADDRPASPWWVLGFVSPGVATDFEHPGSDSLSASALGLLGYRWNERLDLAVGVFASYGLGEATAMGAVGFIWRPSEQWIVQATPPIVAIGWKPTGDWTVSAVGYPAGGGWEVGNEDDRVRQVNLSLWRAALSVERKLGAHWRVNVRGGVAFGGELELRDGDARVLENPDLEPAPFAAMSVKWAF